MVASVKGSLKRLYEAIPFKREFFGLVRSIMPVPEPVFRHLHFKGVFKVPVDSRGSFRMMHHGYVIENELFWRGLKGWEHVSLELWQRLCHRSDTILDIGANTGVYAMLAQAVNPDATIIAVEPVARVFQKLQANAALNGARVHTVCAAVSDHTGTATLYDLPDSEHVLSVSLDPEWNKQSTRLRPVEVPTTTVLDLLRTHGKEKASLLKIDVETHEPAVLEGCGTLLKEHRPTLLIELLNDDVAARVATYVDGLGYEFYNVDDVTWPPPRVATLGRSGHFNFLICQPDVARAIGL
ncbi:MAG: FkbM family methyltransferase [Flavobacteriales bacterium]|nr:FkbM family methyltransferase [Flavobacteriales bacterium]